MTRPLSKPEEDVRKGAWTAEEDEKLRRYVETNGPGHWRSVGKKAGLQRCGKSCRLRWTNYLRPDIRHGSFSSDEEELIVSLHASHGSRWSLIAAKMHGRTDNDIKNHWNTRLKKKLCDQGIDPVTHKPIAQLLKDLAGTMTQSSRCNEVAEQAAKRCFSDSLLNKAVQECSRPGGLSSALSEITWVNLNQNEEEHYEAPGGSDDAFNMRGTGSVIGECHVEEHDSNHSGSSDSMAESSCSPEAFSRDSEHHHHEQQQQWPRQQGRKKTNLQKVTPPHSKITYDMSSAPAAGPQVQELCRHVDSSDASAAAATVNLDFHGTSTTPHDLNQVVMPMNVEKSSPVDKPVTFNSKNSNELENMLHWLQSGSRVLQHHSDHLEGGSNVTPWAEFRASAAAPPTTITLAATPVSVMQSTNDNYMKWLALRNHGGFSPQGLYVSSMQNWPRNFTHPRFNTQVNLHKSQPITVQAQGMDQEVNHDPEIGSTQDSTEDVSVAAVRSEQITPMQNPTGASAAPPLQQAADHHESEGFNSCVPPPFSFSGLLTPTPNAASSIAGFSGPLFNFSGPLAQTPTGVKLQDYADLSSPRMVQLWEYHD